jgi:predicted RNA-binding Zn ribbon-like protein
VESTREPGQWIDSSDGRRFWFDAGARALDFIYTARVRTDFDSFIAQTELGPWLTDHFPEIQGELGDRELSDARALRAAIAAIALALVRREEIASDDIDTVNLYAATLDIPPVLAGSSRQAGRSSIRPAQALSSMAREAVRIFGEEARGRVRECDADDCQLVFYDDSRAGSRRWCSMQRCGNRAKVRTFRAKSTIA